MVSAVPKRLVEFACEMWRRKCATACAQFFRGRIVGRFGEPLLGGGALSPRIGLGKLSQGEEEALRWIRESQLAFGGDFGKANAGFGVLGWPGCFEVVG